MKKNSTFATLLMVAAIFLTANATTYYSTPSTISPENVNSWWTNRGGVSGSHPLNFSTVGDVFTVENEADVQLTTAWTIAGTLVIEGDYGTFNLTSSGSGTLTVGGLTVNGQFMCGRALVVNGATVINGGGLFRLTGDNLNATFTDFSISGSATWDNQRTGTSAISISGDFNNNISSLKFTSSASLYTFSGAGKSLSGSSSIPNVAVTGTRTNNGTLTVGTALSGAGSLTNGSSGSLNIGGSSSVITLANAGTVTVSGSGAISTALANFTNTGTLNLNGSGTIAGITNNTGGTVNLNSSGTITSFNNATSTSTLNISTTPTVPTISTLTVSAAGNTVNYKGAGDQTIKAVAYKNLILSTSGIKSLLASTSVGGRLTITTTAVASIAAAQTLTVNELYFTGASSGASTWGGTGSGAANINTTYFAATTGKLSVTSALPVELTSFTASVEKGNVVLNWKTATEVNNYGFEVERKSSSLPTGSLIVSARDDNWTKIDFVEGNGTTNAPKSYSFTDKSASGKTSYRLKQIDRDGKFEYSQEVEVTAATAPKEFALEQNYPNPFNPTTNISFTIPVTGHSRLTVFNILGAQVCELFNGIAKAGEKQTAVFDATRLSSGIYFYRLEGAGMTEIKKMQLVR